MFIYNVPNNPYIFNIFRLVHIISADTVKSGNSKKTENMENNGETAEVMAPSCVDPTCIAVKMCGKPTCYMNLPLP